MLWISAITKWRGVAAPSVSLHETGSTQGWGLPDRNSCRNTERRLLIQIEFLVIRATWSHPNTVIGKRRGRPRGAGDPRWACQQLMRSASGRRASEGSPRVYVSGRENRSGAGVGPPEMTYRTCGLSRRLRQAHRSRLASFVGWRSRRQRARKQSTPGGTVACDCDGNDLRSRHG